MKFLVFTFFAVLAAVYASEECEKRAEDCVDSLLSAVMSEDADENKVCKELVTSVDCLRGVVNDCLGDEPDEEVEEGMKQLEGILRDNCGESEEGEEEESDDKDDEIARCFEEHEEYFKECIDEGGSMIIDILEDNSNLDENAIECLFYGLTTSCFGERIQEKCGEKASNMVREELEQIPAEIAEACEAANGIESLSFQLLDKKK